MTNELPLGPGYEVTMTRTFDAPREKVWKAWTDQSLVQKWWGPEIMTNPTCEWNATPGGKIYVVMTAGDDPKLGQFRNMKAPMGGKFTEVTKPERLIFAASALNEQGEAMLENDNTVTFEDLGGKTKMTVRVKVIDVKPAMMEALKGMTQGWEESFDKLTRLLPSVSA